MSLAVSTPPSGVRWRCFSVTSLVPRIVRRFFGPNCEVYSPHSRPKAERRSDFLQGLFLVFYPSCFGIWGFTAAGQYRLFLPRSVCSRSYPTRVEFVTSFWAIRWVFVFRPSFDDPPSMSVFLDEVSFLNL